MAEQYSTEDLKDFVKMVVVAITKAVHSHSQGDKAGFYTEKKLILLVAVLFDKFEWKWVPQALNTLSANIKGKKLCTYVFLAKAGEAGRMQGHLNRSQYLQIRRSYKNDLVFLV